MTTPFTSTRQQRLFRIQPDGALDIVTFVPGQERNRVTITLARNYTHVNSIQVPNDMAHHVHRKFLERGFTKSVRVTNIPAGVKVDLTIEV